MLLVAVVAIGAYMLLTKNPATDTMIEDTTNIEQDSTMQQNNDATTMEQTDQNEMVEENVKEFEVSGANLDFTPSSITVNQGDTVRIIFTNTDSSMPHDWVLDEFNARTQQLGPGESETIEFVATETGEFEFYCSVNGHRANGMVGTLTVE